MILFDYECPECGNEEEHFVTYETRDEQKCSNCGTILDRLVTAKAEKAFTPRYDLVLGEYLNNRQDRDRAIQDIRERSIDRIPIKERRAYKEGRLKGIEGI